MTKQKLNNDFIKELLKEKRSKQVDWVRLGRQIRQLKNPPKLDRELDLKIFADGLRETVQEKLKIALKAQEFLKKVRVKRLRMIVSNVPAEHQWFYLQLEAQFFTEYFVISKWINYWLNIWYEVNDIPQPRKYKSRFDKQDISRAKDCPIEDLYDGNLRKAGSRLNGLCPFHEEKHPSFFIFPNNSWYCFGACSEGGDSISFAMKSRNMSFVEAVKFLTYGHN